MKKLFLLCLAILPLSALAQIKYCTTPIEFTEDQWVSLDNPIEVDHHSQKRKWWWGGSEFKFSTGVKKIDKLLKKDGLVVMYDDSLYVNCRRLIFKDYASKGFGIGYTKAFRFKKSDLLIVCPPVSSSDVMSGFSFMFGLIGATAVAAVKSNDWLENMACYVVRMSSYYDGDHVPVMHLDTEQMEKLLSDDPSLLDEYKSVEKKSVREGAANTLDILFRKGWIKK